MKADYIPKHIDELDTWEETFLTNLATVGGALGLQAGEIAILAAKVTAHRDAYAVQKNLEQQYEGAVEQTNILKDIAISGTDGVRLTVTRIKTNSAYTEALGDQLGIIGEEISTDVPNMKPVLILTKQASGGVSAKFKKLGADAVEIRSKRGNETSFTFLARDTNSPYPDNRENLVPGVPEKREYIGIYVIKDQLVGLESDVASITV